MQLIGIIYRLHSQYLVIIRRIIMRKIFTPLLFTLVIALLSIHWQQPQPSRATVNPFYKMYLADNVLLVSEYEKGIGVYDVSNLSSPVRVGSIALEGNADMAVSGKTLYCDSFKDLVVFDFSNPSKPTSVHTIKDVFNNYTFPNRTTPVGGSGGVSGCGSCSGTEPVYIISFARNNGGGLSKSGSENFPNDLSQSGSNARFCIVSNYLYCVDKSDLVVFDIVNPGEPVFVTRIKIGWGIETIFPYNNYLFIGSQSEVYIYNVDDIRVPKYVSRFIHARACDPVFVEGSLAYVTLNSGGPCGWTNDALHIVDIRKIETPALIGSTGFGILTNPFGLTVHENIAFVCDGGGGVKVIDVRNAANIKLLGQITGIDVFDTIKRGNNLFVIGPYGVYIYDVTKPENPISISTIKTPT